MTAKIRYNKIFIDEDPNQEEQQICPECQLRGVQSYMRYMFINIGLAVYKCSSKDCMYPNEKFKYKNYNDKTVYRIEVTDIICETPDPVDLSSEFAPYFDDQPQAQLPPPPPPAATCTYSANGLTNCDANFLDTEEMKLQREKAAIEKLESELHDLLSEHLDLDDKPDKVEEVKPPDPLKRLHLPQTVVPVEGPPEKRRKLSKVYEFFEKKTGVRLNGDDPFKKPAQPTKVEAPSTRKHHHHHRHYKDYKLPKEVRSPSKLLQPSLFLQNIERRSALLKDLTPKAVPVKIEVLRSPTSLENIAPFS